MQLQLLACYFIWVFCSQRCRAASKASANTSGFCVGMCATAYKSTVVVFGGVADQDDGGANMSSVFFNDLYSFDATKRQVQIP